MRERKNIRERAKSVGRQVITQTTSVSSFDSGNSQLTYAKMMQSGAINSLGGIKESIETAQGNTKLAKNIKTARNITMGLAMEGIMEMHNNKTLKKLSESSSVEGMVKANEILQTEGVDSGIFDKHAIKSVDTKDIINNAHRNETISRIRSQSSRYVSKKYGVDIGKMKDDDLKKLMKKATYNNQSDLQIMIKNELDMRGIKGADNLYDSHFVGRNISMGIRTNILSNIDAYKGYNDLNKMYHGMKTAIRAGSKFYGLTAKGAYNIGSSAHEGLVRLDGLYGGIDPTYTNQKIEKIRNTRKKVNDTFNNSPLKRASKDIKGKYGNYRNAAVAQVEKGVKTTGRAAVRGVKKAGNIAAQKSRKVDAIKQRYVGMRGKVKGRFKFNFHPVKGIEGAFKAVSDKFNIFKAFIKKVAAKIILPVVGFFLIITVAGACIMMLSTPAIIILDAVDNKDNAMQVAYGKLMEKEEKFSNAVTALYQTESPAGIIGEYEGADGNPVQQPITKYTKSNINYYDGDGKELSNGQTIKGILAMGAVYIDQDFKKYGNWDNNILSGIDSKPGKSSLLGSTYKDYVAALYDSTHLIGLEKDDQSTVYYCPDRKHADPTCNNVITSVNHGSSVDGLEGNMENCDSYTETTFTTSHTDAEGNSETEEHTRYTCNKDHRYCGGHIDLDADVLISNIYYPEEDISSTSIEDIVSDPSNGYADSDRGEEEADTEDGKEKKEAIEPGYSMYVLDKYATAIPEGKVPSDVKAEADANMDRDTTNAKNTDEPHTEMLDILNNVVSKAEGKSGVEIDRYVYWADNDAPFWDRHPTYWYLKDDGNINDNKKVTNENGTPYRFVSYTSESSFNEDFAEHGWDAGARSWVQGLLTPDWQELYGISSFGCMAGTPLSKEQVEALIASNESWADISPARKYLMALCLTMPEGHPYSFTGTQPSGRFAAASQPPLSCGGFIKWLYWSAFDMADFPGTTGEINRVLKSDPDWEHYVGIENMDKLEPGDIILKKDGGSAIDGSSTNHVLIYAGKNANGQDVYFHEASTKSGYKQLSTYSFAGYENTIQIYKYKKIDDMVINYGENLGFGDGNVDVTEVGEIAVIGGDEIWIGWEHNESGGKGVTSVGDNGWAFGMFQFDSRFESLYGYMKRMMDTYPGVYEEFRPWYNNRNQYLKTGGGKKIDSAFHDVWIRLNSIDKEEARHGQINQFYDDYMQPVYKYAKKKNVDLDDYSPVLKGTLWSISIYAGQESSKGALDIIRSCAGSGYDEEEMLRQVYTYANTLKGKKHADRWLNVQLNEALAVYRQEFAS